MSITIPWRDPDKAYVGYGLWLPTKLVNVQSIEWNLTYWDSSGRPLFNDYFHTPHHIVVPRMLIPPNQYHLYRFPFVDVRPTTYPKFEVYTTRKPRDHYPTDFSGPEALLSNEGGLLHYACVAGDTTLNLNRGGKGFKVSISAAYRRFNRVPGEHDVWDPSIPTRIRSEMGGRIGLNDVLAIFYKGRQLTLQIILADGTELKVTADHEIATTRGYVKVEDLNPGVDYAITDRSRGLSLRKAKQTYRRLSWYPAHPYVRVQTRHWTSRKTGDVHDCPGYALEEHRAVYEAHCNGLTLEAFRERCRTGNIKGLRFVDPAKFHIHHLDGNVHNNVPDNLMALPVEDHLSEHRPGATAIGRGVPTPVRINYVYQGGYEDVYDVACADPYHNFVANGVVVANCGKGKTSVSLRAWAQTGTACLVVVDETTLMEQWKEVISGNPEKSIMGQFYNKDGSIIDIGIIQGPSCNFKKPITLATVQTLARHADEWPEELRRFHGVIIFDEVHVFAAQEFSKAVRLFMGRRWGVSATPFRQDKMETVYLNHIGPILDEDLTPELIPRGRFVRTGIRATAKDATENKAIQEAITDKNGQFSFSRYTGWLGRNETRNERIVRPLIDSLLAEGRKILALSNCRDQTNILHAMYPTSGVLNRDIPQDNRLAFLRSCRVTFGIYRIAQKGLDAIDLDTLILLTPVREPNLLQQAIGRIQRVYDSKKEPLVVVLEDEDFASFDKAQEIRAYFRANGIQYTTERAT